MASIASSIAAPVSPPLSAQQLETLRAVGHERFADAGDVLYRVGDRRYPFIAILDGEVAIHDGNGARVRAPRIGRLPR